MKTRTRFIKLSASALVALVLTGSSHAADVTVYDSIVSLATNTTKNYTFTDGASGQSVVVAATITGYSPAVGTTTLQALDSNTRVGGNNQNGFVNGAGVNFSAALVSGSSGITAGSIKFRIAGLGIRAADGSSTVNWTSSAGSTNFLMSLGEAVQSLDVAAAALSYTAQLRFPDNGLMQLSDASTPGQSLVLNATFTVTNAVDPRTNSWFTTYAGQYARIYTNDVSRTNGLSKTTWTNGTTIQTLPTYAGVQEIYSSSNWVYIRSSGLGTFVMGPWYLDAQHTQPFPNWPVNQKTMYRIPRIPTVPATKTANGGGAIGYFVDGPAMFNSWDAYTYSTVSNTDAQNITGYWNRDAYVNEGSSFDPNNAHQAGGQYHYHANPPALRYQLGDHITFNSTTKIYTESTNTPTKHSPILAWTADGYPLYGPYGYSVSNDASSGIRRMISGYVLRNGQYGTSNLTVNGRKTIPAWSARLFNVSSNQTGPNVTTAHILGAYMEDNDYLGDRGIAPGTNTYDLDGYNGRFCVTPEFPGGTYAYFVSISSNGAPVFPYNIGRGFYGSPTGGAVTAITESVTTNFLGNTNLTSTMNPPTAKNGTVTLSWSAIEGGSYQVEATTNLSSWTVLQTGVSPNQITGGYTNVTALDKRFYRAGRTSVTSFDSAGTTLFGTNGVAPGGSAYRGQTVIMTITLTAPPNLPPAGAPVSSVTVGSITGSNATCTASGTVTAVVTIPSSYTPTGLQNVVVTFQNGPTYTLTGGFTINP